MNWEKGGGYNLDFFLGRIIYMNCIADMHTKQSSGTIFLKSSVSKMLFYSSNDWRIWTMNNYKINIWTREAGFYRHGEWFIREHFPTWSFRHGTWSSGVRCLNFRYGTGSLGVRPELQESYLKFREFRSSGNCGSVQEYIIFQFVCAVPINNDAALGTVLLLV